VISGDPLRRINKVEVEEFRLLMEVIFHACDISSHAL
jgi:hypothetical protein